MCRWQGLRLWGACAPPGERVRFYRELWAFDSQCRTGGSVFGPGCWDQLQTHHTFLYYTKPRLNQPLCVTQILTSSFHKPQSQDKQIKPISSVEIALKITTVNVEMYYLHPPNPIYFMHILPSKLNTAHSLCGKSLSKDFPYLIAGPYLIPGISLSNHAEASKCAVLCSGLSHCGFIGLLTQHVLPDPP